MKFEIYNVSDKDDTDVESKDDASTVCFEFDDEFDGLILFTHFFYTMYLDVTCIDILVQL